MVCCSHHNYYDTTNLALHDALPICMQQERKGSGLAARIRRRVRRAVQTSPAPGAVPETATSAGTTPPEPTTGDRKSTRLNSSHVAISYAVFCLKKKT